MTQPSAYARLLPVDPVTIQTRAGLDPAVLPVLSEPGAPADLVARLTAAGAFETLAAALCFMLPKREAVWWVCLCSRLELLRAGNDAPDAALLCAENWARESSEDNRYPCFAEAEAANFDTPGAWAAMAAFWSGPSLAPRGGDLVPPPDYLTGVAAHTAVTLCRFSKRAKTAIPIGDILAIGLEIADGGSGRKTWTGLTEGPQ